MPALFFLIATTPVETLGCRNRGLLALAVSFSSGIAALFTAYRTLKTRRSKDPHSNWWLASSLIFTVPVIALIILA
ncbi:MAG: hypothetical protein ACD_39C01548G0002 [uncultured bacterium]|nr:MAG: hypothetical protein ACD_39C01548G0002 [uncultured bacterium]